MKRIASKESYLKTKTAARPTEENERIYWDKLYDISKLDPGADGSRDEIIVLALTNLVMSSDSSLDRDRVRHSLKSMRSPTLERRSKLKRDRQI